MIDLLSKYAAIRAKQRPVPHYRHVRPLAADTPPEQGETCALPFTVVIPVWNLREALT